MACRRCWRRSATASRWSSWRPATDRRVPADVALFDTFAGRRHTLDRAAEMVRDGDAQHVVLYTWDAAPEFVRAARRSASPASC